MEDPTLRIARNDSYGVRVGSLVLYTSFLLGGLLLHVSTGHLDSTTQGNLRSEPRGRMLAVELSNDTCTLDCCLQLESQICVSANPWIDAIPLPMQIILVALLISGSALFSGLTLGLLGLDLSGLEIIMHGDDPVRAEDARKVYTVRKNGNLLLCTLLLGNVTVNSFLSILLGEYFGGIIGLIGSTVMIVVFGEIIPQALCARYALWVGSRTVSLVRVIMFLFYPFAAPLAYLLNKILGNELPTTYSHAEMSKFLQIHVNEGVFDQDTAVAMVGALKYKDITVKEVMTTIENTFMLNVDERLSFSTIALIFKAGYSRIPVFEVSKNNVIGLLFVKDLIFIDPEDETPIRNFVQLFGRGVHVVWPDDKLGDVLHELKKGKSHMALVRDVNNDDKDQDPFYEIRGIITLEDIIEEIIGGEIVDETDAFVDGSHLVKVNRMENFDWGRLSLLDSKLVHQRLSFDEVKAVVAHLRTNYGSPFELISDAQMQRWIGEIDVEELSAPEQEVGQEVPKELLYEKGVETSICTLILNGKVTVLAGADKFRSDVSSWAVLGAAVFTHFPYVPDFTAFVSSSPCRCIRLTKDRFDVAIDLSTIERTTPNAEPMSMSSGDVLPDTVVPPASASKTILEPDAPKVTETMSRRNKLIAALSSKGRNLNMIAETTEDEAAVKASDETATFASVEGLNSLLSAGGAYQPRSSSTSSSSLTKKDINTPTKPPAEREIEYIGSPSGI